MFLGTEQFCDWARGGSGNDGDLSRQPTVRLSHGNLLNLHPTPALLLAFWAREGIKINLLTQLPRSGPELTWGFSYSSAVPCLVLGLPNAISPFPKLPGTMHPRAKQKRVENLGASFSLNRDAPCAKQGTAGRAMFFAATKLCKAAAGSCSMSSVLPRLLDRWGEQVKRW